MKNTGIQGSIGVPSIFIKLLTWITKVMPQKENPIQKHGRSSCFVLLLLSVLLVLSSCGRVTDYSTDPTYAALFSTDASDAEKELTNCIIAQLAAYNSGDADGYYAMYDMTEDDRAFNVASYRSLWQLYEMTNTIEEIHTAWMDETHAQAQLVMDSRAVSRETEEELYHYQVETKYTLEKVGKHWKIQSQDGDQTILYDYMEDAADTLSEGE